MYVCLAVASQLWVHAFPDADFQARLAEFKKVARIPGPPNEQPKWLALRDGDLPHIFVPGKRWADEEFRSQSIKDTPLYMNPCANCDKSDPYVFKPGGEVYDDLSEDEDEDSDDNDQDHDEKAGEREDQGNEGVG